MGVGPFPLFQFLSAPKWLQFKFLVFCKAGWCKTGLSEQGMAHMWFMHDAHLGRAFFFLEILAEYTLLSNDMVFLVCSWNEVGDALCQVSSSPFCTRTPFGECRNSLQIKELNCKQKEFILEFQDVIIIRGLFSAQTVTTLENQFG